MPRSTKSRWKAFNSARVSQRKEICETPALFPTRAQLQLVVLLMAFLGGHEHRAGVALVADGQAQHVAVEGLGTLDVVDQQADVAQG